MKNLILHIGLPKTGTSSIQYALNRAREKLLKHGILYPETGQWADYSHHGLGFALRGVSDYGGQPVEAVETLLDALSEEYDKHRSAETVLISSEIFQALVWPKRIAALKRFTDQFEQVKIIAVLRRQDLLLESLFKQHVKDPTVALSESVEDYFDRVGGWFNYKNFLSRWSDLYGRDNLLLIPHNARQRDSILTEFTNVLSAQTGRKIALKPGKKKNLSLNGEGLEIKWQLNGEYPDVTENERLLEFIFETLDCTRKIQVFSREQRQAILDRNFQNNLWMFNTFPDADWSIFQNVHPTGQFIGQVSEQRIDEVRTAFQNTLIGQ